jgi:aspartate aminotransferase
MPPLASSSPVTLSQFASGLTGETAFDVLAVAQKLRAKGKDIVLLNIGDSPFPTPKHARAGGIEAIEAGETHYCASLGLPEFREAIARNYSQEFGVPITADHVVVAHGAKPFEQFFCEAVLDPGDAVLVFSPHFPTYEPNIQRRGAHAVFSVLKQENEFRPNLDDIAKFVQKTPKAKAIFLNSPHNPTGGVATAADLKQLADIVRGKNIAVFCDEPYCHMVWQGRHDTLLKEPGMLDQAMAAYTFSKSYSMSGWRLGYAVTNAALVDIIGKMINTSLSCVPPIAQRAGQAALEKDQAERDEVMAKFQKKVELLVNELRKIPDVKVLMPVGTFYVFPDVSAICRKLGITSHGLAMYLLEGADEKFGVSCLGGECFGEAGRGFLRFSCAEPDDRLVQAVKFVGETVTRTERVQRFLEGNAKYRIQQ